MIDKITEPELMSLIADVEYGHFGRVTLCVLTLESGFKVVDTSVCVNARDFSKELGEEIAYRKAFTQLFELEAYHRFAMASQKGRDEED